MNRKPLKRHVALQPLSREHHFGLLLSWKIRKGITKKIPIERIKSYVVWFYKHHLIPHFQIEEKHIFTVLGNEHKLVVKALQDHKEIQDLILTEEYSIDHLHKIEKKIVAHIRFEERILFTELQKIATKTELEKIEHIHKPTPFLDCETDVFWK